MKHLLGLVIAVSALGQVPNRAPLAPNVFYALPLGAVKPTGWLKQQLRIQADGLSGHLDEIQPDAGAGGEHRPQYVDGLLPLAYLLDDPTLIAKARKEIDWTLDHQTATSDWWPSIAMLKALTQFQEVTGDPRVVPALEKYFAAQSLQLANNPLPEWAQYRWGDELVSILWLYNRNGDPKLLDLAHLLAAQGFDWKALFADYPYKEKTLKADAGMKNQGVNNAMALKTGALWSLISGNADDRNSSKTMLTTLDQYHGMPTGTFAADEYLAGRDPSQGIELCALVEEMYSLEQLLQVTGDPLLGHRLERIAFNALPGAFSKDMWAYQPEEQTNQVIANTAARGWTTGGARSNVFGFERGKENLHQGWPKFTASLWMATADNGLAAVMYSPSEVKTSVAGTPVHIVEDTNYPFDETVTIHVDPDKPVAFPLRLRIPTWTGGASVKVNGASQRGVHAGEFLTVSREWRQGDTVMIRFPMPVIVSQGFHNSAVVSRGPLLFSLTLGEKWKKTAQNGRTADWDVLPTVPWNYALAVSRSDPQSSFSVELRKQGLQPFSVEGAPVVLNARGFRVPEWKLVDSSAGPLPESPVKGGGTPTPILLIPYGAAKLRITEFPVVQTK